MVTIKSKHITVTKSDFNLCKTKLIDTMEACSKLKASGRST